MGKRLNYRSAGVSLRAANRWVGELRTLIRTTARPGVRGRLEGFGGVFDLSRHSKRGTLLVASADGAGTKVKLAQLAGRHQGIGVDVVAMNVNDVITFGAEPLFFLDYIAMGRMHRQIMGQLVRGIARGCRESRCALLGGETAEMPGCYGRGEYDIAGFAVGVIQERHLVTGRDVRAGDVVMGLPSSGVHANGFSLVRKALTPSVLQRNHALLRQLLVPTRLYVKPILAIGRHVRIKAMAHITGGGLTHRLPSLTAHTRRKLRVELQSQAWKTPRVFRQIQQAGRISQREMEQTFNMGIGFTFVCAKRDVAAVQRITARAGTRAAPIGSIAS